MRSVRILVKGRVQGVGFRYSTLHKAQELSLAGFVKNQADGSVYIEASGVPEKVDQLIQWCKKGPSRARVEEQEHEEIDTTHQGIFKIK